MRAEMKSWIVWRMLCGSQTQWNILQDQIYVFLSLIRVFSRRNAKQNRAKEKGIETTDILDQGIDVRNIFISICTACLPFGTAWFTFKSAVRKKIGYWVIEEARGEKTQSQLFIRRHLSSKKNWWWQIMRYYMKALFCTFFFKLIQ